MPSNSSRSLDRIIRTLRSLMRSTGLPRPDRVFISTVTGSVQVEFDSGTAPDRLAALLLWVTRLDGVTLTWSLHADHTLIVTATARNAAGLMFGLTTLAAVSDFDGTPGPGDSVVLAGTFRLVPSVAESVTFEEVARLVHLGRAVAARRRVAGATAA
ncbi:hypothetical protein AB0G02_08685 [Actinosynnema sp. NPDC023658]|uniref:hypothetical protein n=1 Tax=Actinosynnema sp. NPDC023658 TaxID=3155465 RepID=UPI0033BFEFCB